MTNIERIQQNVSTLQGQGQSTEIIQAYLKSEGFSPTRYEQAIKTATKVGGAPIPSTIAGPFLQGLTFNTADEIEAAFRAGAISGPQYEQMLSRVRAGLKEYGEQYPVRSTMAEIGGGLAPVAAALGASLLTGGAAAPAVTATAGRVAQVASKQAPTLLGQIGRGSLYGGASGVASGVGGAEGGLGSRVTGGLVGGGLGFGLGAAAPAISTVGAPVGRKIADVFRKTPVTAETKAQELIARALIREGTSPEQIAARQAQTVSTLGARDETLADIGGESMRRLARGAMAVPSGAQTDVRQMLVERAVGAGPRITKDITDLTAIGERDILEVADEIIKTRAEKARPLYEQAFAAGEVYSPKIDELLAKSRDIKTAIESARGLPQYADLPPNSMLMLDKAYKYVGDAANEAKRAGKLSRAKDLDELRIELLNAITDKQTGVPVYGEAVKTFASESLLKDALEAGSSKFLKKSPAEINRELAKFTDDGERQMYRLGAVQSLRDEIYGMKETGDIAGKFINSREMRDRMRTVFNSEGEYEAFVKNLERERQMAITRSRIEGGSPTAPIQQDIAEMAGPSPTELIGSGAQMVGGNVLGGMANLYRQLGPRIQGIDQNVAEALSRSVLDPSFNQQQQLLMGISPVMQELQRRALGESTRRAGYSTSVGGAGGLLSEPEPYRVELSNMLPSRP
jgi:hypothetical protein